MKITGKALTGNTVRIDGSISSQFLTSILMVAPLLGTDTDIKIDGELVSKPYIDITLDIMQRFGVNVQNNDYKSFTVKGGQSYQALEKYMKNF